LENPRHVEPACQWPSCHAPHPDWLAGAVLLPCRAIKARVRPAVSDRPTGPAPPASAARAPASAAPAPPLRRAVRSRVRSRRCAVRSPRSRLCRALSEALATRASAPTGAVGSRPLCPEHRATTPPRGRRRPPPTGPSPTSSRRARLSLRAPHHPARGRRRPPPSGPHRRVPFGQPRHHRGRYSGELLPPLPQKWVLDVLVHL
jgi:hypothetical protein